MASSFVYRTGCRSAAASAAARRQSSPASSWARDFAAFECRRSACSSWPCRSRDTATTWRLRGARDDRLHQPGRARAYPYLDDAIAAAEQAGALGAALSGAGGSVIAIADRNVKPVGDAMARAAARHQRPGRVLILNAVARG